MLWDFTRIILMKGHAYVTKGVLWNRSLISKFLTKGTGKVSRAFKEIKHKSLKLFGLSQALISPEKVKYTHQVPAINETIETSKRNFTKIISYVHESVQNNMKTWSSWKNWINIFFHTLFLYFINFCMKEKHLQCSNRLDQISLKLLCEKKNFLIFSSSLLFDFKSGVLESLPFRKCFWMEETTLRKQFCYFIIEFFTSHLICERQKFRFEMQHGLG